MSKFSFSKRSLNNLAGVNEDLVKVVHRALELSEIDFTVVEGVRTKERQVVLVNQGMSKTMNSYHIPNSNGGRAVVAIRARPTRCTAARRLSRSNKLACAVRVRKKL